MLRKIEHRFLLLPRLLPLFMSNTGNPPFLSIRYQGSFVFPDLYYDTPDGLLFNAGLCARVRGLPGTQYDWEAKRLILAGKHQQHPIVKAITTSAFEQVSGLTAVAKLLETTLPPQEHDEEESRQAAADGVWGENLLRKLPALARFTTSRMEHLVDGKFSVRFDETTVEHQVGKVVLEVNVNTNEEKVEKDVEQAQAELEAFVKRYGWFFGKKGERGEVKDKVRAFLDDPATKRKLQDPEFMLEDLELKEWWMETKWNTRFVDEDVDVDVD